jgi:hypothetical protein
MIPGNCRPLPADAISALTPWRTTKAAGGLIAALYENHSSAVLRGRSAFPITETELKLMAAAAIIRLSKTPNTGYSTPAAIGKPNAL